MASKAREIKCRSAPSTPSSSQRKKATWSDANSPSQDPKPIPNYLRPTISSCKSSTKQESAPILTTAKKAPIDKANSSQLRKLNPRPLPKPAISPTKSKTPPIKNSKSPLPSKNRSISKGTTDIKKHKTLTSPPWKPITPEEKALSVDIKSQANSEKEIDSPSPKKEEEPILHYEASEESMCGYDEATSDDGEVGNLKFQQETELVIENVKEKEEGSAVMNKKEANQEIDSPKAYDEAIEETASKLAEQRNKVKASAVISLQEPKGQPSTQKVEEAKTSKAEGQPSQPKDEEEASDGKTGQESKQEEMKDVALENKTGPESTVIAEKGDLEEVTEPNKEGSKAIEEISEKRSNVTKESIKEKSNATEETIVSVKEKNECPKESD